MEAKVLEELEAEYDSLLTETARLKALSNKNDQKSQELTEQVAIMRKVFDKLIRDSATEKFGACDNLWQDKTP